jgi:hypothetical protein
VSAPGDYVLDSRGVAVGRIESVLTSASGVRLVVARAFSKYGYVVCARSEVALSQTDPRGLTWHTLSVTADAVARAGVFRRELGRLVKDPFPMPFGAPRLDGEAQAELTAALAEDPLTGDGDIAAHVSHGVAVLEGWIPTVGGKVIAERIARTIRGVWDAVNRLVSDDELVGAVRAHVRRTGSLADAIQELKVERATVRITLLPGHDGHSDALRRAAAEVPGVRAVELAR